MAHRTLSGHHDLLGEAGHGPHQGQHARHTGPTPICLPLKTIVFSKLDTKLRTFGLDTTLCNCILDFLTGRPQAVRIGNNTSSTMTLNKGPPQGCVLSPLLYSLFTHDCVALHDTNAVIKFADDTTVVDLITNNDESAYKKEVSELAL